MTFTANEMRAYYDLARPAAGSGISDAVQTIIRDVCELEPADAAHSDTVCVDISDLQLIVERALLAMAPATTQPVPRADSQRIDAAADAMSVVMTHVKLVELIAQRWDRRAWYDPL